MVNYSSDPARPRLRSAGPSHPPRHLARLATGETTVSELAKPYKVSAPAITKHLHILEEAGLVSRRKQGREHHCRLEAKHLQEAEAWMAHHRRFWTEHLDVFERFRKETK